LAALAMILRAVMSVSALTIALAVAGCGSAAPQSAGRLPDVVKLTSLHGQTEAGVVAWLTPQYGPVVGSNTFPATDPPGGELYADVCSVYPPDDPKSAGVMIKELQWKDGTYRIAVWFHKINDTWTAFESVKWHNSIAF
jgi:hypothetical protein